MSTDETAKYAKISNLCPTFQSFGGDLATNSIAMTAPGGYSVDCPPSGIPGAIQKDWLLPIDEITAPQDYRRIVHGGESPAGTWHNVSHTGGGRSQT